MSRIHPDYIQLTAKTGRKKYYMPKLIGARLSRQTFFKATDAINYRRRFFERYWRLKAAAE